MQTGLSAQGANGQRLDAVLFDECERCARDHFSGACRTSHEGHRIAPGLPVATRDRIETELGGPELPPELWGRSRDTVRQRTMTMLSMMHRGFGDLFAPIGLASLPPKSDDRRRALR